MSAQSALVFLPLEREKVFLWQMAHHPPMPHTVLLDIIAHPFNVRLRKT